MLAQLLDHDPGGGPSVPVRVRPEDFQRVGQQFADAQGRVTDTASSMRATLDTLVGAAGNDEAGRSFGSSYLPAADAAFAGFARLVGLLGSIGVGLGRSGENHRRGDADSAPGTGPGHPFPPIAVSPAPAATGAPSITGEGQSPVPDWAAQYWPDGDPDRLQDAGRAWQTAADAVESLARDLHTALTGLVTDNDGEDVRALAQFWDRVGGTSGLLIVLPGTCRAISDGCWQLGFAIRDAHDAMLEVVEETLVSLAAIGVGSVLLTPVTFGGSDVAGVAGGAAVIAGATARLAVLATALLQAVGAGLVVAGVAEGVGAMRAAIDATPDPRNVEVDTTRVGDTVGRGRIDEAAKAFSPAERAIADRLAAEGHDVTSVVETNVSKVRSPDALVDGVPTEFKSADQGAARTSNWVRNVLNASKSGGGQARAIIIDATGSSLSAEEAGIGVARFVGGRPGYYDSITIWTSDGAFIWP